MKNTSTFRIVLLSTVLLGGALLATACGESGADLTDSGIDARLSDGGIDALGSRTLTINAGTLDLAGETLSAHWSGTGGQQGEVRSIGVWPSADSITFDPSTLEAPAAERTDLNVVMVDGTWSFAWFVVERNESLIAVAENHMLLELSGTITADSVPGRYLNLSADLGAGVHLLQTREYTDAEVASYHACVADNPEDPDVCDSFKVYVEVVPFEGASITLVAGDGDSLPDLD